MSKSPWVRGPYTPVENEVEAFDLEVEGSIPPELNGMLARIGPNPIGEVPPDHNLFFGDGMMHALTLKDGRAQTYRNRWVRTQPVAQKLGEESPVEPMERIDVANTQIFPFAGSLYALTETSVPYRVSDDLQTEGREDFSGFIDTGFTAHPHIDQATGDMHAIGYDNDADPSVTHYVIGKDGKPKRKAKIALNGAGLIHDFAATENFILIFDLPLQHDAQAAEQGASAPYSWDHGYEPRIGIRRLDAEDARVRWFDGPKAFVFHPMNAWEEINESGVVTKIHCDVCRFEKMFDEVRSGPGDATIPQLYRWTVDFETGRVSQELIDPRAQEFPRIDDRYWGRENRFGVTTEIFKFTGETGIIAHYGDGNTQDWSFGQRVDTSEAIFVPHDEKAGEGEGYILATACAYKTGEAKAAIFDAQHVAKGPLAEIKMPQRLPAMFHGNWIPQLAA